MNKKTLTHFYQLPRYFVNDTFITFALFIKKNCDKVGITLS